VPILHDTVPTAFLIEGDEVCRLEPMPVELDSGGRLVHTEGPDSINVRVESDATRLAEFVVERLRSGAVPARWHLLAALDGSTGLPQQIRPNIAFLLRWIPDEGEPVRQDLEPLLDSLASSLASAEGSDGPVTRHVAMAKKFLFGEPRDDAWRDPYTDTYFFNDTATTEIYTALPKKKVAAAGAVVVALVGLALYFRYRRRRARTIGD
jgi:hypothetical protein